MDHFASQPSLHANYSVDMAAALPSDPHGFPLLDLPPDVVMLVLQRFTRQSTAHTAALRTLASTSTTLLQTVLEAGTCLRTFRPDIRLASCLSRMHFSDASSQHSTAVMRGHFPQTPSASAWNAHMSLKAMAEVCAAQSEQEAAAARDDPSSDGAEPECGPVSNLQNAGLQEHSHAPTLSSRKHKSIWTVLAAFLCCVPAHTVSQLDSQTIPKVAPARQPVDREFFLCPSAVHAACFMINWEYDP
jgi:hypothetical protein